jgi:hypothetical protein
MRPLPQIPPGPRPWMEFAREMLEAVRARTPLATERCEVDERADGCGIIPTRYPSERLSVTQVTIDLTGITIAANGYYTATASLPGVPDHTPFEVDTGPQPNAIALTQQSLASESAALLFYNLSGSIETFNSTPITVRVVR